MNRGRCILNDLDLLPCTMENGVFVTNVKWIIKYMKNLCQIRFFESPELVLHDPIKNEPSKIQLRLIKRAKSISTLQYWHENEWKFYVSVYHPETKREFEFTAGLRNNMYYGSKTFVDDLREYLTPIHEETIAFGGETLSVQECSKEFLLAFIDQEYNEDFIIECEGKEFKIKKIILQARSPVFETMLSNNNFKEARENRMVINDYGSEVVEKMVDFLQTDFAKDSSNCGIELYLIARKYISQSFMIFTRLLLVQKLSMRNFRKLLGIVRKHGDKETEELLNEWYIKNHPLRRKSSLFLSNFLFVFS